MWDFRAHLEAQRGHFCLCPRRKRRHSSDPVYSALSVPRRSAGPGNFLHASPARLPLPGPCGRSCYCSRLLAAVSHWSGTPQTPPMSRADSGAGRSKRAALTSCGPRPQAGPWSYFKFKGSPIETGLGRDCSRGGGGSAQESPGPLLQDSGVGAGARGSREGACVGMTVGKSL